MQRIWLEQPNSKNNFFDVLSHIEETASNPHYYIDPIKGGQFEIAIQSLHSDTSNSKAKIAATVGVASYAPEIGDAEWPEFFIRYSRTPIIACDSFVKKQIDAYASNIPKVWINLDGATPIVNNRITPVELKGDDKIKIASANKIPDRSWVAYQNWLTSPENKHNVGDYVGDSIRNAHVVIGLKPIGHLLSTTFAQIFPYVWLAYDPNASLYLDCRYTHTHNKALERLSAMEGGAKMQVLVEQFVNITEEITNLVMHSFKHPVPIYTSNVSIVERIVNELNRITR